MSNQVVKVKRDVLAPCMTCPICLKLFVDATTVVECLHTFCRKCIYKKLCDEEMESCPVCNVWLGCAPLDKLRADHNLLDLRAKIFPHRRRKVEAPEVATPVTPVTLPSKRKERSLSSLVTSTPEVSTPKGVTRRRSQSVARKASKRSSIVIAKSPKKCEIVFEDHPESFSTPLTLNKSSQNALQNSTAVESSLQLNPAKEMENCSEPVEEKVDELKPLNCLEEEVSRSKSPKLPAQVSQQDALDSHENLNKWGSHVPEEPERPKKVRKILQKKTHKSGGFSPQALLDTTSARWEKMGYPIWFSLVASNDQNGDALLPQISASYLRIKDGNIPVSYIQKYIKTKLNLESEDEVQIKCMGQPVSPSLTLKNLVNMWLQTNASNRVSARIGSSAKDFMMVLGYARNIPSP